MDFDDLFEKGNDSGERQKKIEKIDFDSFVERVKLLPFKEGQYTLWAEAYKLPRWYIILNPNKDIPFIGKTEEKGWFFLFTDLKHADEFAKRQGFIYEDGSTFSYVMEPLKAARRISEYGGKKGIYGVRFNEGEHGWFSPIANLLPMYEYLKDLKRIQH